MTPPQQSFCARNAIVRETDQRLVKQLELMLGHGLPQFVIELPPGQGGMSEAGLVQAIAVTPLRLGAVKR